MSDYDRGHMLTPSYSDDLVRVYECDHAALAEHLRETGERPDAMIVDAPYSERTHAGHDSAEAYDDSGAPRDNRERQRLGLGPVRRGLGYGAWCDDDVKGFVDAWSPLTRGWMVSLTDHVLAFAWAAAFDDNDRLDFSPIACVEPGSRVRLVGDGPSQWSVQACVARPRSREFATWGTLPGAYVVPPGHGHAGGHPWVGGKPVWLIRALVRDYSRPGDLIVDPTCGAGTLGVAVRYEGRRAILADKDPAAIETTIKRLRGERTKPTRDDFPETAEQPSLFAREAT